MLHKGTKNCLESDACCCITRVSSFIAPLCIAKVCCWLFVSNHHIVFHACMNQILPPWPRTITCGCDVCTLISLMTLFFHNLDVVIVQEDTEALYLKTCTHFEVLHQKQAMEMPNVQKNEIPSFTKRFYARLRWFLTCAKGRGSDYFVLFDTLGWEWWLIRKFLIMQYSNLTILNSQLWMET